MVGTSSPESIIPFDYEFDPFELNAEMSRFENINQTEGRSLRRNKLDRREICAIALGVARKQAEAGDSGVGTDIEIGKR